jgi:enterochelin esterase-like enzyme
VLLRLPDPERRFAGVRLCSDLPELGELVRHDGEWRLELDLSGLDRLEYEFEVRDGDGGSTRVRDPGNPERAPGAFGEKSVLLAPGYAPPAWLQRDGIDGAMRRLAVPGRGLAAEVEVGIWSPADAEPGEPLPLLVAHDGPEYDRLAALTHFAAAGIASRALPRHRVALLVPGERNEWYSASARYAGALVRDVVPALRSAVAVAGPVVGMGASLGGLAMLHAQRRHPGTFGGLFLQSGSFFRERWDKHEARFPRFGRIARFAGHVLHGRAAPPRLPTTLTVGTPEENLDNNRAVAQALEEQGWDVRLVEHRDAHNWVSWRDAFDPHLPELLLRAWS